MRAALLCVLGLMACTATRSELTPVARARVASDYGSYSLRRVGVLPFEGAAIEIDHGKELQASFVAELSTQVSWEIVSLTAADLEELPQHDSLRRGRGKPEAILELARRYRLDGIIVGTVAELSTWPQARVGIEVDLVASETGLAIWSGRVQVDAAQQLTREHLQRWLDDTRAEHAATESAEVWLMSPRRFSQFAAAQVADLF